jgi:hypothetical protein
VISERVYEVDDASDASLARMAVEANPLAFRMSQEEPGMMEVVRVEQLGDR